MDGGGIWMDGGGSWIDRGWSWMDRGMRRREPDGWALGKEERMDGVRSEERGCWRQPGPKLP